MIRDLQSFIVNVDAQNTVATEMKRGTFVTKDVSTKKLSLATGVEGVFIVDRDNIVTYKVASGLHSSDYDTEQETIAQDTFAVAIPLMNGIRKATSEYTGADVDLAVGKSLTIADGKLVKSETPTCIKSLGFIDDNGHKLLGFEIIK